LLLKWKNTKPRGIEQTANGALSSTFQDFFVVAMFRAQTFHNGLESQAQILPNNKMDYQ